MPAKIYPDPKWTRYWTCKRHNAKISEIDFTLTTEEQLHLIEEFPVKGGYPDIAGYHLGRLDHDKPYTIDNVEWQWHADNVREGVSRRDQSYNTGEKHHAWQGGKRTYLWKQRK